MYSRLCTNFLSQINNKCSRHGTGGLVVDLVHSKAHGQGSRVASILFIYLFFEDFCGCPGDVARG